LTLNFGCHAGFDADLWTRMSKGFINFFTEMELFDVISISECVLVKASNNEQPFDKRRFFALCVCHFSIAKEVYRVGAALTFL